MVNETLPPRTKSTYILWNIDLLYCNLTDTYPSLSDDLNQDLVQRHGKQLLRIKENKKIRMFLFFLYIVKDNRKIYHLIK